MIGETVILFWIQDLNKSENKIDAFAPLDVNKIYTFFNWICRSNYTFIKYNTIIIYASILCLALTTLNYIPYHIPKKKKVGNRTFNSVLSTAVLK